MPNTKPKPVGLNKKVPTFSRQCTPEQTVKVSDFKGQKIVLYFYPKDNTPAAPPKDKISKPR
jgi:peroxiredoxin